MKSPFDVWFDGLPKKDRRELVGPKIELQVCFNAGLAIGKVASDARLATVQLNAIATIFFMGATSRKEALRELGLVGEKYAELADSEGLTSLAEDIRGIEP